jgi:RecJ-like exonuclease
MGDVSNGLTELLESHIRSLSAKLSRPFSIHEIEEEMVALNDLVYTFKRRDELLEKLLDTQTAEDKRREIRDALNAQRMRVAENQAELERTHARSHQLLQKSALLIIRAQRQIDKTAHKYTGYALEPCALCDGLGGTTEAPCLSCKGRGSVLVHQPSLKCPRCSGNGKPSASDRIVFSSELCLVCRGSGWVMTTEQ